jgi:hypothetical protein
MFRYTWKLYSERLMTLTGVYGFWKYVSNLERRENRCYLYCIVFQIYSKKMLISDERSEVYQ